MDKYIGKLLDNRYEIQEIIGIGGMAVVYKAHDRVLERFVAIKIMKDEFTNDEEFRRRFRNESHAVAKLSHNNIVSIFDVSPPNSPIQYIVMELIEGITLKNYLLRKGKLSWQETLFFAQQISRALSHAHSRGIIHQDIKPHNIILLRDGTVKVTDFGIARFEKNQETRVIQEAIGSVHYISPEQAKSSRIDHRADLYSLGIVMYEMLTGHVPFDGETPLAIVMQHISAQAPLPSTENIGIPLGMDDIVMRAMCPTLAQRYSTADEVCNDLERLKNNPNLRFVSNAADLRNPGESMDETIALPHMGGGAAPAEPTYRPAPPPEQTPYRSVSEETVYRPQPAVSDETVYRPQKPEETVYRPSPYDDAPEEDEMPYRAPRKKQKRRLSDSPAAMAGIAVGIFAVIAVTVAVMMMTAGSFFGIGGKKLEAPQLIGMQVAQAMAQYGEQFKILETERKEQFGAEIGEILDQNPSKGTRIRKGGTITVIVCSGETQLPDNPSDSLFPPMEELLTLDPTFVGANYQYVQSRLENLELTVEIRREDSLEVEKDKVIRTEPAIDEEFRAGDKIVLIVSNGLGESTVPVPNVLGIPYEQAKAKLEAGHLQVSASYEASEEYPKDEVFRQSIKPEDGPVKTNTEIILSVSQGPAEKPKPEPEPEPDPVEPPKKPSVDPEESGSPNGESGNRDTTVYVQVGISDRGSSAVSVQMNGKSFASGQLYEPVNGNVITIPVTGPAGTTQTVDIYVNGAHSTQTVVFPES